MNVFLFFIMYNEFGDIMNLDAYIIDLMSRVDCVPLDYFFEFFTHLGDYGILYVLIGIIFLFFKKTRKTGLTILLSMIFCGILGNLILKPTIARVRPYNMFDLALKVTPPKDFSFPSGHSYGAFAMAGSVYFAKELKSLPFFVVATLIAISRIYFTLHYPTDVVAGILMGLILSYISNKIISRIHFKK